MRAVYSLSGTADVALATGDPQYQSAVMSMWDDLVNRKYYVTGGVGSGETSEGFGKDYSLRNNAYCESCSGCGELFFQWKMNLAYGDFLIAASFAAYWLFIGWSVNPILALLLVVPVNFAVSWLVYTLLMTPLVFVLRRPRIPAGPGPTRLPAAHE